MARGVATRASPGQFAVELQRKSAFFASFGNYAAEFSCDLDCLAERGDSNPERPGPTALKSKRRGQTPGAAVCETAMYLSREGAVVVSSFGDRE